MSLAVATARQRTATALTALTGWEESRFSYEDFPADSNTFQHLAFAVGVPSTAPSSPAEGSQLLRGGTGGVVQTDVRVRWAYRVRSDSVVSDTDSMLAQEALAISAVLDISGASGLRVLWAGSTRRKLERTDWGLGEMTFRFDHHLALT